MLFQSHDEKTCKKIRRDQSVKPNNVAACRLKTEGIQIFNKAQGGPGSLAELSADISCQHFITVAVIKSLSPWLWPRAAKLHLDWRDKPPAATAAAARVDVSRSRGQSALTGNGDTEFLQLFWYFFCLLLRLA